MMEKNLGYLISLKRKQLNISQRELAKQTGIANSTISRIEKSIITQPDPPTLKLLSEHLSLDYYSLLCLAGYIDDDPETQRIRRILGFMPKEQKEEVIAYLLSKYPEYL